MKWPYFIVAHESKQLKHNQLNEMNIHYIQKLTLIIFEHVVSIDTNYQSHVNCSLQSISNKLMIYISFKVI